MIVPHPGRVRAATRGVLWTYILMPVVLVVLAAMALVLLKLSSSLAGWDLLLGLVFAGWAGLRIRRFFRFRKRLSASSDSFASTIVADPSRSVVLRLLPFRYLTLYAPFRDQPPNIRLHLLLGQSARLLSQAQEVRVRGPESGAGPLVLVNPVDDTPVLGYGRRFDAGKPGWLTVAWLTCRKAVRAILLQTLGWIRALPSTPQALARGAVAAAQGLARALVAILALFRRGVAAGAQGLARTLAATITLLARTLTRTPRAAITTARAIGRAAAATAKTISGAVAAGAQGLARTLAATITLLARTLTRTPGAAITTARAIGRAAATTTKIVSGALASAGRGITHVLAVTGGALARAAAAAARGAARAVVNTPRALSKAAGAVARAAIVTARGVRLAGVAGMAVLARAPALALAALVTLGHVARLVAHLPAQVAEAARRVAAVAGRLIDSLRRPRVWLLYVGLPLTVFIVGALGTGLAASSGQAPTGPRTAIIVAAAVLAGIGVSWLLLRLVRYVIYRTYGFGATDRATARVIWVSPRQGWRRCLGSGRLALEVPGGHDGTALLVSLFGGQQLPRLLTGEEVSVTVRPGHAHGPVAVHHGRTSSLVGFGRLFGPYKLAAPEVVTQARRVLRRDLIVYGSLSNKLIHRHRAFSRILSRGGYRGSASVVGSTRPRWYERFNERDSVWLQLDSSSDPRYVRMRLLGRQDGTTLSAGEAVSLYGSLDGRGSIIAVGSRHRTTLLGVGEPWRASERSEG